MSSIIDQSYLLNQQYKDASNLDARVKLHRLFSTNPYGWQRWCFDQFTLPADARVLEIGCGPAHLWTANLDRLPADWRVTLTDFSAGMLDQARQNLGQQRAVFRFETADAQQLPFDANAFDAVIANHMLYHVPDRAQALREMQRVLQPGRRVYIATNGRSHLRELLQLNQRFDPALDFGWSGQSIIFSLEAGEAEVTQFFHDVHIVRYDDALHITEAGPLVEYILSMSTSSSVQQRRDELQHFIEQEITRSGAIRITKESGMFIGVKV